MSLPFTQLTGLVYRSHNPRWSFEPESGAGAARYGGRFNPPGMPALYTSRRPETAWLEAQQSFAFKAQPMTLCAYQVDCSDILDLGEPDTRRAAGTDLTELGCAWEEMASRNIAPPTWRLAMRLREAGCVGIIVPSFAAGASARDVNVVLWIWSRSPPHQIHVVDDFRRLPQDDSAWR